jgi:hypothetical protein
MSLEILMQSWHLLTSYCLPRILIYSRLGKLRKEEPTPNQNRQKRYNLPEVEVVPLLDCTCSSHRR